MAGTVIGLDLSLQSAGCCAIPIGWTPGNWAAVIAHAVQIPAERNRVERLDAIAEEVLAFVRSQPPPRHVFIEAYAFGQALRSHHLGELGGVVRLELWRARQALALTLHTEPATQQWRQVVLGKVPRKDAKVVTHQALVAAGAPFVTGDELDAFGVANWGITELDGVALCLAGGIP